MTNKIDYEMTSIHLSKLSVVWRKAQRPFNQKWADEIAEKFDPDKFEPILVTKPNGAGVFHIVEGQHRKAAAEKWGGSNQQVPCRIIAEADPSRAAEIFLGINEGRKAVKPVQRFLTAIEAGREHEVTINEIVKRCNYRISDAKLDGSISAVAALKRAFANFGPNILRFTLDTCRILWGEDPQGVRGDIIDGVSVFMNEFHTHVDRNHLKRVIASLYPSPHKFLDAAKYAADQQNETLPIAMSGLIRDRYNRKMRDPNKKLRRKAEA